MGQKVNPKGLRVGIIKDWDSNWYAGKSNFAELLKEDHEIRKHVKSDLFEAGISDIHIERTMGRVRVTIHTAKPGVVIGKGGTAVEDLKKKLEKLTGKTVLINVEEILNPDVDAQLEAERIAADLENRITFRRAMKQAIQRTMRAGAKGVKTSCAGRLGGADIARTEHYSEGTIPLQTLRADIRYGEATARTVSGAIGVKVWVYIGEVLPGMKEAEMPKRQPRQPRRGQRRNNRGNENRNRQGREGGRDNRRAQRSDRPKRDEQ
ncbi:MAG: 30S ribosomal protein S3 [Peptoniphilaceae bacterium]|nr:30S ribosomal protein S3 [Peptoniphilaceae bacterium]MDY5766734.1 30S ribosomal protein S3 [Peptoniphilaceae bacterium]